MATAIDVADAKKRLKVFTNVCGQSRLPANSAHDELGGSVEKRGVEY